MFLIVSAMLVLLAYSDWVMVDSSFLHGFSSSNNWYISKYCESFNSDAQHSFYTCQENQIKYARLKKDNSRIDKIFEENSFQSQVIVDVFLDNAGSPSDKKAYFTLNSTLSSSSRQIMNSRDYFNSDLTQNARRICNSSTTQYLDFQTYVSTSAVVYKQKFNISIGIESQDDNQILGVRNLFVYIQYCLPTCLTCSSSISCLTCHFGTVQTDGSCICNPDHQFAQTGIGCRQECQRDYFIARSDNICVPDGRIKSNVSYFEPTIFGAYSPFQFIQDSAQSRSSPSLIFTCSATGYVGSLFYNEGMSLQFANSQSLKFIRLRITFITKGFSNDNKIQILLDDQVQGEIIKATSGYTFDKLKKIYSSTLSCTQIYDLIRIEAILRTYSVTPKLILKGAQLTVSTSLWGFRNITIDSGNCRENCAICTDFSTCQQCNTNYVLFQNGCVSVCPVHSSNCVDYADMIPNSRYLAKGFYDLNMSTSDINKFFDETISTGSNFQTGQKFSIFPTKFVLGGVMVWNNAIYKKSWSISKPHYAVTIRFNVTYGDSYVGNFYYTIQEVKSVAHPKPSSGGQNFIGKSLNELQKYFEIFENPFKSSPLNIEFQCTDTTADARDQFCAISDYFIVVHYCLPFCQDCNDGTSCVTWESGHTSSNCQSNEFIYFDSSSESYSCITCNQPGCLTCKNLEECTFCDALSQYNTLNNGVCLSINPPSPPSPTVQCHKFCETCTGALINNCETCVSDFHRTLSNNQCLCSPGFFYDGINVVCLPVCGDLLIVDGEDCDDGNYNPYDGCHNCKFGCDDVCKQCLWGICLDCQIGFQFVGNRCIAICGDNLLVKTEECEDGNQIPNDGCYDCKFSCPYNCIDCQFSKCIKCDEINGWYLKNNTCQPICGDGIVAIQFEQCDDKNQQDSDGCHFCLTCSDSNCSIFISGICIECQSGYQIDYLVNTCFQNSIIYSQLAKLDQENNNEPICGDGIVTQYYENCDDLFDQHDCFQCLYTCQDSCSTCYNGQCYQCNTGWTLNTIEKKCFPIDGDNLVVGREQCDDGNQIYNDGCFLSQFQYQISCEYGIQGACQKCISGFVLINSICKENNLDGLVVGIEQCDDQNLIGQDGCFQNRFDCPQFCLNCVLGYCLECDQTSGYGQVDRFNNKCQSFCGDGLQSLEEDCDAGNEIPYDGCFQCKYSCDQNCIDCQMGICQECQFGFYLNQGVNSCFSQCGDGLVAKNEQCDDGIDYGCFNCQIECQKECLSCYEGQCYECEEIGWEIDLVSRVCNSNCGDGIIVGKEQCDDGNEIDQDGCYQCEFQCQLQCTKCFLGICLECGTEGWQLYEQYCIPICGDQIVLKNEECDDGNIIPYDGCFECKFQCQVECTDCRSGICYECGVQGWHLINHHCDTVCGDGFIVQDLEECDDGNFIQYDGCYQCQFQCSEMCTLCQQGICYECDNFGWMIDNYDCKPFCGDGIIIGNEQCDDMNNNQNDGCHQCQFACDQYCIDCQLGICQQCELGRFLVQNVCISQCGDGAYVKSVELCDDGNQENGDGCDKNCKIETNYLCLNKECGFSLCAYSKQPQFNIKLLSTYAEEFQDVQVTFDQKMKYYNEDDQEKFSSLIINIIDMKDTEYDIVQQIIKSDITILLKVNFKRDQYQNYNFQMIHLFQNRICLFNSYLKQYNCLHLQY